MMMHSTSFILLFSLAPAVLAQGVMKACSKANCEKCPVTLTTAGTGYPKCVIYQSEHVFGGYNFKEDESSGGYEAYWDIPDPDPGCAIILKTPAGTEQKGCGVTVGAWANGACAKVPVDKSFMVQFCCGDGDCRDAGYPGAPPKRRDSHSVGLLSRDAGVDGPYVEVNGTRIKPFQVGYPREKRTLATSTHKKTKTQETQETTVTSTTSKVHTRTHTNKPHPHTSHTKTEGHNFTSTHSASSSPSVYSSTAIPPPLQKRDCDWKYKAHGDTYTKPSPNTQVVSQSVSGGAQVTITKTRSQSRTTTFHGGLEASIFQVVGVSVGADFTKSSDATDSYAYAFTVPEGQNGVVGFTATLKCTKGRVSSDKCGWQEGEACIPYKMNKRMVGTYAIIAGN